MNVQVPHSPTESAGQAAVEVGRVFGNGGTDGLILYALILATFLMFLALVAVLVLAFRSINRMAQASTAQAEAFAEASNESAEALKELAVSVATKGAEDATYRFSATATLARIERVLNQIEGAPDA